MTATAAALLDELMGRNRNIAPHEKVRELRWEDRENCKHFLVKFCPHELFVNTKADLGTCDKMHDDEVRKLFSAAPSHKKLPYQEDFVRFCRNILGEVERKIEKGKQRLALNKKTNEVNVSPAILERNRDQIKLLCERIKDLEEEAEQAGICGNVEHAQGLMKLCDQLKDERDMLRKQIDPGFRFNPSADPNNINDKQMEVCDVCGAFLIVGDAQQRIDDHLMGKQHVGYSRLRTAIEEISQLVDAAIEERRQRRFDDGYDDVNPNRSRSQSSRPDREKSREHSRSRHRSRDSKHRSCSKDVSRSCSRSRSRSRSTSQRHRSHRHHSKSSHHY